MIEFMSMIAWAQLFYLGIGQQPMAEDDMESGVGGDEQYIEIFLDTPEKVEMGSECKC